MNSGSHFENNYLLPPALEPQKPMPSVRRQLGIPALALTCIYLVTIVVQSVLVVLINLFLPSLMERGEFLIVLSSVPMYAVAMPLSLIIFRFAPGASPQKHRMSLWSFLGLISICFAISTVGSLLGEAVNQLIGALTGKLPENDLANLTSATPLWANLLFVGILAPILEEIFFRKLIIDRIRCFGDLPAILLSGIVFGLIHGNFSQFFYAAMVGLVFGLIYLRTGRLRYTIGLHMIFNLVGGVFTSELLKHLDADALASGDFVALMQTPVPLFLMLGYYLFLGLCLIAAPIALILLWKKIVFERGELRLTARQWLVGGLINPAVWLLAALIVLMFFL